MTRGAFLPKKFDPAANKIPRGGKSIAAYPNPERARPARARSPVPHGRNQESKEHEQLLDASATRSSEMTAQATELEVTNKNVAAIINEAENILAAAQEHAGFEKILKFRKGEYFIGDEIIPLGTEFLAHPEAWTKCWIKFEDGKVTDRKLYRVARGEIPPEREDLDDLDRDRWLSGSNGVQDPWVKQHLLPFENLTSGDVVVFATSSIGGMRAVGELCSTWAKRKKRGNRGQPIVRLRSDEMPTKSYGKVPCPKFEIVGWNDMTGDVLEEEPPPVTSEDEFNDQIPY
jgi:hypothetical protein